MEETGGSTDLAVKNFRLIDFSSENDSLVASDASSSTTTDHQSSETLGESFFELTGNLGINKVDIMALTDGQSEQMPQLLETLEQERLRTSKCNLRKSLTWDSAFFESPGVLDAEELSSMIEGAEKEDTLFEDIRASIQKSSKASNITNSSCKEASMDTDNQANCSAKVDLASQNSPVLQNGNSTLSLARLSKVVSRTEPLSNITTKRASLGVNSDKTETDNAKVGRKGIQVPKSTGLAGRRAVPKPALSPKSSSSASFGAIKETTKSSSSCDSSSNSLSNNIHESPSTSTRRKPETRPPIQPSSGSIPKALSKVSSKKKPSDISDP